MPKRMNEGIDPLLMGEGFIENLNLYVIGATKYHR